MKKVILLILVSILLLVAFTSCAKIKLFGGKGKACEHEWTEATCQSAKTCKLCGTTEGSTAPHKTAKATCTDPQRCTVCGFTTDFWQGALGHDWIEANCLTETAKHCDRCGLVEGEPAQHDWSEPTCFANAKCSVCLLEDKGTQLEHDFQPTAPVEPTCTTPGETAGVKCTICDTWQEGHEPVQIPALEHKGYEVEIPGTDATCDTNGLTDGKRCEKCGQITDAQLIIEAKGHQRYTYDEDGQVLSDGYIKTEYPVNPNTGLPYAKCESDGVTTYECQVCHEHVEIVEPKVHHDYNNATCTDENAHCV